MSVRHIRLAPPAVGLPCPVADCPRLYRPPALMCPACWAAVPASVRAWVAETWSRDSPFHAQHEWAVREALRTAALEPWRLDQEGYA